MGFDGMRVTEVCQFCVLDEAGQALIKTAMNQLQLSARTYHCILKLVRTVADQAGSESIQPGHLAEMLQYRPMLMVGRKNNYWEILRENGGIVDFFW